jgi:hypothetical protein
MNVVVKKENVLVEQCRIHCTLREKILIYKLKGWPPYISHAQMNSLVVEFNRYTGNQTLRES